MDLVGANDLFRLVSAAYVRRSLVITSNWPFEPWTNFQPDVTGASEIQAVRLTSGAGHDEDRRGCQ